MAVSSVRLDFGPYIYIYIPKLRIKIRIENESLKYDVALRFSVVVDDIDNHFFRAIYKSIDVGNWETDKISYIDYFVRGALLDLYFKNCPYSDDYDKEFHRLLEDECAYDIITSKL